MQLSENFSLEELTFSEIGSRKGLANIPGPETLEKLRDLAAFLEEVRTVLGRPVNVNSAYRSQAVNEAVGGKPTSQHLRGEAADIRVPGMTPNEVVQAIRSAKLPYDQLIREFDRWTHVSIAPGRTPRGQVLIIDSKGARPFPPMEV